MSFAQKFSLHAMSCCCTRKLRKCSSMCIILIPYGHSIKLFEWNDGPGECVGEDVDSGGGGVGGGQVDDDNANIAHCHLEWCECSARIFNCISYERASQNWPHMRHPHRLSFANKNKFHSAKNRQDNEAMEWRTDTGMHGWVCAHNYSCTYF